MPRPSRLGKRLEDSARVLLVSDADFASLATKLRDENGPLTPRRTPPRPLLIFRAQDQGRVSITPIRKIRLAITVRTNAKLAEGQADPFDAYCGLLEALLDSINLKDLLDSPRTGLHVMLATRDPAEQYHVEGDIREQTYFLDTRCVGTENVAT